MKVNGRCEKAYPKEEFFDFFNCDVHYCTRKAGINRSYMSSIENGKRIVSVSVIERVAGTLGIAMEELFGDADL